MQAPRCFHCQLTINEKVYVFGGENQTGRLSSIEYYDGIVNYWTPSGSLIEKRLHFTRLKSLLKMSHLIDEILDGMQQELF